MIFVKSINEIKTTGYLIVFSLSLIAILVSILAYSASYSYYTHSYMSLSSFLLNLFVFLLPALFAFVITKRIIHNIKKGSRKAQETAIPTIKGMLIADKKVNVREASQLLSQRVKELKHFIYILVSKGEITGHFEGDDFVVEEGGVESFVDALEKQFASWQTKEENKTEKKE